MIESIPVNVGGTGPLSPEKIAAEKIPTPAHLRVGKELAAGGMGHVHPAVDRNLLRQVALKRLDKDFATMMSMHHKMAIDMADVLLKSGSNAKLKAIAAKMKATQQDEIKQLERFTR